MTHWTTRDVALLSVLLAILALAGIAAWKGDRVDSKIGGVPQKVSLTPEVPMDGETELRTSVTSSAAGNPVHIVVTRKAANERLEDFRARHTAEIVYWSTH